MPLLSRRWTLAAAGVFAYAAVSLYFGGDVRGQRKAADEKPAAGAKAVWPVAVPKQGVSDATPIYFGINACGTAGCHAAPEAKEFDAKNPVVCQYNELTRWSDRDKHGEAWKVLDTGNPKSVRAQRMETILARTKADPKGYKVSKDPACLACHALVTDPKVEVDESFHIEEGVNCVVCHGAYKEWVIEHAQPLGRKKYRAIGRADKQKKKGMIDLWNATTRAKLCASCHIGSKEEGKFVTHEMYAAGHPPLPGFEPAAFSDNMPRHWRTLREKAPAVIKIQGLKLPTLTPFEFEQSKTVLVGAAVSLGEYMKLLAGNAKEAVEKKTALNLSNFDCYACHHDLKAPSWRQKRGYKGKPGRVPMRPWSTELVKLAVEFLGEPGKALGADLEKGLAELERAFSRQPFGDAGAIEKAASKLATLADTLAEKVSVKPLEEKEARTLQLRIPKMFAAKADLLDYDSARQVGWGFKAMTDELKNANPGVKEALKKLDAELFLTIYRSKGAKTIEPDLEKRMELVNSYNPEKFRALLLELSKALGETKP